MDAIHASLSRGIDSSETGSEVGEGGGDETDQLSGM